VTIPEGLLSINNSIEAIRIAINNKDVPVSPIVPLRLYPEKIMQIAGGIGGGGGERIALTPYSQTPIEYSVDYNTAEYSQTPIEYSVDYVLVPYTQKFITVIP